jgi:hypothetical protein
MADSVQNKKRRIKFICKLTRYGLFIDIGPNASDMHINRLILASMNQVRKPGETKRLTPREYWRRGMKPKATSIFCYLIGFLAIVLLAAWMILPRWIPRENPEGVYDARIWLANCMCDDGRAFLVVTNHRTCQTVWTHPGDGFINTAGTWKSGSDDHSFAFEFEDETGKSFSYQADCYWGGLEWTVETAETKRSFWFPRLISGVYCDYYNKSFWLTGAMIAGIILIVTGIIDVLLNIWKANKLLKQHKKNRQKH